MHIQGGKKSLAIIDEFYTFDLIEIHVKNRKIELDFKFQGQKFSSLHCILLITKVKLFHRSQPNYSSLEKWQKSFLII